MQDLGFSLYKNLSFQRVGGLDAGREVMLDPCLVGTGY